MLKIIYFVCIIAATSSVQELNENDLKKNYLPDKTFRSGKVQQIWIKAKKMQISLTMMSNLYNELKYHDQRLSDLKEIKLEGGDKDGLMEGEVQKALVTTMKRFGLAGKRADGSEVPNISNKAKKNVFQDNALNDLWNDVLLSEAFSIDELDQLFLEFQHHQDKVIEMNMLQNDINEHEDAPENSILHHDHDLLEIKQAEMKELREKVQIGFEKLEFIAKKSKASSSNSSVDPRIRDLRHMVENSDLKDEEKLSLQEELRHFEIRIEKHNFFKKELHRSSEKIAFHHGKVEDAPHEHLVLHHKLKDKVEDLADQVTKSLLKLRRHLVGNIKHNEL